MLYDGKLQVQPFAEWWPRVQLGCGDTFVISLVMVTVAVIVLIWSSVMIVGTMREFGGCEEDEWSRATCEQITCSPQRSMVIVKTRRCSGNRFESITRNCTFPTECSPTWSAKEDNCSLTKGGKEVRVMLMKPNKVNNDAIVAFAGLNC
ncbi:hypothetical protein Tcan_02000 [Toxocara canis]|uniref:Uncharacterized protein n=1 Tax=Toxocara canis TaxID=6265 RepID=A0A0B2VHH4_TOXCA|nr:hypothetical protein Tcan_02000 [Toxocara canis]